MLALADIEMAEFNPAPIKAEEDWFEFVPLIPQLFPPEIAAREEYAPTELDSPPETVECCELIELL